MLESIVQNNYVGFGEMGINPRICDFLFLRQHLWYASIRDRWRDLHYPALLLPPGHTILREGDPGMSTNIRLFERTILRCGLPLPSDCPLLGIRALDGIYDRPQNEKPNIVHACFVDDSRSLHATDAKERRWSSPSGFIQIHDRLLPLRFG